MIIKLAVSLLLLTLSVISTRAQGFLNLDFSSANIPSGTPVDSFVPISSAIPGWTGYLGTNQQSSVLYNDVATGAANLAILGTNAPGAIPGNPYTVVLQAGFGGPPGYISAAIAQTAVIPANAESILFAASFPYASGWQVTIAGQNIPVSEISTIGSYYGVYAGNVSAFAGQDDELRFTALAGSGPTVNLYLDSISFSPNPIPEPGVSGLSAVGGLFLAWRCRKARTN